MFLEQIGADARVRALFQPHDAAGIELARVSFAAHEQYRIFCESGEREAAPAGRLRWDAALPAVGDWVAARLAGREFAWIESVLPRRTSLSRRASGSLAAEQVIAANLDLAILVCGLDGDFNLRRLERYLVLVAASGAEPLVVLNKADLCSVPDECADAAGRLAPGLRPLVLSARQSVEPLRGQIAGRTIGLLGSSGAGKSTIANALLGEERQPTAAVRAADSRGRHTTTSRMLMPLPGGGAVIDNPGMRELQLWAGEDSLDDVFGEIAARAAQCRFGDCTHTAEPGCAVRPAVESGAIDPARWGSYTKLQAEMKHRETEQDARARAAQKQKWKTIHKAMRHHPKYLR